ncbi:hypothetical protein LY56_01826 [Roseinatronobacter thiooxidans]|uniref:Uncharacterized protein n=1 Tax=Roseinatronobacter thiooxidans TaxID=121821 RepID=A0A2W7Q763_9RHOB|nr:hypothetical protein LY56_01826 [Roseinatronobacter thiooxidans]
MVRPETSGMLGWVFQWLTSGMLGLRNGDENHIAERTRDEY